MKTISTPTCHQTPLGRKSLFTRVRRFTALPALLALLGAQSIASAQTETFDSGASIFTPGPNAWLKSQIHPAIPMTYTFPATDWGTGVRLEAHTGGGALPAAVGFIYRTNIYRNFYVAVDVAAWKELDQAILLIAHGNNVNPPQDSTSYIINYDVLQDGEDPGDRLGGQFQLSVVSPGFATLQLGIAEFTLVPGGRYRFVLKGVESVEAPGTFDITAQAYDHTDLTAPLVTLVGQSSAYSEGASGLGNFSRSGADGTSDSTFDNYYAAATDPNVDITPAIRHPIAGTAQVVTRTPAGRNTNFYPPASGISFTARTFTTDNINVSATKLYLNNVDVSASLSTPANAPTISFTTPTSPLAANTIYSARIEVESATGLKGTNTFWFDTFTDAYLATAPVKTVEVEDYNHTGGQYLLEPIPVSGFDTNALQVNGSGVGYLDLLGTEGVDFHDNRTTVESDDGVSFFQYRAGDAVGTVQGPFEIQDLIHTLQPPFYDDGGINRGNDTTRQKYAVLGTKEYQVMRTEAGEWLNYTRVFPNTNYNVYLRAGSFGSTTVSLDLVNGDPTQTGQTTSALGAFSIPNQFMRSNYRYQPLMSNGVPAVVNLAGTNTIRLTMTGTPIKDNRLINLNYLLFVPVAAAPPVGGPTVFDNFNDGNDTANPAWDHFDPIGGITAPPASFTFPSGHYRIQAPVPLDCQAGPSRAGSFLRNAAYTDFYLSADVIDFDDTVRQAFGIVARVNTPGLGTTGGYLFSWEPGSGTLPGTNNGDLDISRLVNETPIGQIETAPSGLHLTKGKSYRFVFMGSGTNFEAQVYELPDTSNPLIRLPANDPDDLYPSGAVGLIAASQSSCTVAGDATFDNFLATTAEPRLTVETSGGNVTVSWPVIPFRLQSATSLNSPNWTDVTSGITQSGGRNVYTSAASGTRYFRLIYP